MFYLKNGWYFGRNKNASVRIIQQVDSKQGVDKKMKPKKPYQVDLTINQESWASIIATVSAYGEADNGYYRALKFHNENEEECE